MLEVQIKGTGSALPERLVYTSTIERELGISRGTIEASTEVISRYLCSDETQVDLAVKACKSAMCECEIPPDDIDLVISGSSVPYQPIPSLAPLIMQKIGISNGVACAFDVNSTCLSFVTALETAANLIAAGKCKTALVFSAERASCALPWKDKPETAALFGDGAAAVVITSGDATSKSSILATHMRTYPSAYEASGIKAGGTRYNFMEQHDKFVQNSVFEMDGKELFRLTSQHFENFYRELLDLACWTSEDIDLVVPHQASPVALRHMIRQLGLPMNKVFNISSTHGNQIAASIPISLDMARKNQQISSGSKVLLLGTSAGVSFGGMALVL